MTAVTLSAPGKTFLSGEYAVLNRGKALILNTRPRFELKARVSDEFRVSGFPEGSPARRWLAARQPLLKRWRLEFLDPYGGRGGFGASGAQFAMVHAFTTFLQSSSGPAFDGQHLKDLVQDLRVLSAGGGSGADVLAQSVGQVAMVDMNVLSAEASPWPFQDLGFVIAKTAAKVATHEHLRRLDSARLESLLPLADDVTDGFRECHSQKFLNAIRAYATQLFELGLEAETTTSILRDLRANSWCLAAKGCGALGADTVVVICPRASQSEALREIGRAPELSVVASQHDLSEGLHLVRT